MENGEKRGFLGFFYKTADGINRVISRANPEYARTTGSTIAQYGRTMKDASDEMLQEKDC